MKISKQSSTDIADLTTAMQEKQAAVEDAISAFNDAVGEQRDAVEAAVSDYNEALNALKGRIEDERDEQQAAFEEKSERWQEGDRGNAVSEWIEVIGNAADALDEISVDLPDAIDTPDFPEVEELPDQPE